MRKEVQER